MEDSWFIDFDGTVKKHTPLKRIKVVKISEDIFLGPIEPDILSKFRPEIIKEFIKQDMLISV
jgi:hypothetical protein